MSETNLRLQRIFNEPKLRFFAPGAYGTGVIRSKPRLCEICVTECCTVVQSTAIAMGAVPFNIN